MSTPAVSLPEHLLPTDGRFGAGPSKVRPESLTALWATGTNYLGTSHRREGVRSVVRSLRAGLADLFALPPGYEVLLGNGGATAFWDAALFRLIERRSQHYVFGEFSGKFAAVVAAAPHLDPPFLVEAPYGSRPDETAAAEVDAVALTHNETSTGVAMPVRRPATEGLVLVDATSAAGAVEVDPGEFDVYYFSPQKAFGADGGLWTALCSPAAVGRIEALAGAGRWAPPFLDLAVALGESRRDQTYNTPGLATLFLFSDQVDWLLDRGGLSWAAARCRASSGYLYQWAESSSFAAPFVADPDNRSPTVVTVDLDPDLSASEVAAILRANGILDTESYRKLGRNQLRFGVFPNVEPEDVERLAAAVDWVAAHMGIGAEGR